MLMRQAKIAWALCALLTIVTACSSIASGKQDLPFDSSPPGWTKDANTVIFRLDQTIDGEALIDALNRLPLCTIFGDGRVIWTNSTSSSVQVLETQIDDSTLSAFLQF